jgi:adenylate cyclase, class 2
MPIEIEKKYRLTKEQWPRVYERLQEIGAERKGEEFEENTIYTGHDLAAGHKVLRLRRVGARATLTFKQRLPTTSSIKHQLEEETVVANPTAMSAILEAMGFTPSLVYEKRRETWLLGNAEIVLDELPFGLFMEIEGKESEIEAIEDQLAIRDLEPENCTYPQLTTNHGTKYGDIIQARFPKL